MKAGPHVAAVAHGQTVDARIAGIEIEGDLSLGIFANPPHFPPRGIGDGDFQIGRRVECLCLGPHVDFLPLGQVKTVEVPFARLFENAAKFPRNPGRSAVFDRVRIVILANGFEYLVRGHGGIVGI